MNVHEKLLQVQQNLKAPKNQYNKFGDFHYRSCEDIQEAVKPLLAELKAVLLVSDEMIVLGERYYIKATATFLDVENGEKVQNTAYARETAERPKMDVAQITGSCSSYARKYALNGLFCIDDAKDPDHPVKPEEERKPVAPAQALGTSSISAAMVRDLKQEANELSVSIGSICQRYRVNRLEDMTSEDYWKAKRVLQRLRAAQDKQYQYTLDGIEEAAQQAPFR